MPIIEDVVANRDVLATYSLRPKKTPELQVELAASIIVSPTR